MTQVLYRRYRPQAFTDVVGQNHVADTLRSALRQGKISHAYLFTGPRGTGKTSTARILAKAVNCQAENVDDRPDNTCAICTGINEGRLLDLIEIDAASHTGVDDVRELRDRVAFAPSEATYKVYVIDEVHMLSNAAFNALLKTLEEPPAHVIFVLATTEPHKIPATVVSRCQRFDFHRISTREIAAHLSDLAGREGVDVSAEAIGILARSATGSMRDGISLLDQVTAYGHERIDAELVREVLGMVSGVAVSELVEAIAGGDAAEVLVRLHGLIGQGVELTQLVNQLIDHLRTLLLLNVGRDPSLVDLPDAVMETMQAQAQRFQAAHILHAIRALNEAGMALKTPFAGYLPVELALLDAVGIGEMTGSPVAAVAPAASVPAPARPARKPAPAPTAPAPAAKGTPEPPAVDLDLDRTWKRIVNEMRQHSPKTQAMLRSGKPVGVEGDAFVISFEYDFHRDQVTAALDVVNEVVSRVMGRPAAVKLVDSTYVLQPPPASAGKAARGEQSPQAESNEPVARSEPLDPVIETAVELGATVARVSSSD